MNTPLACGNMILFLPSTLVLALNIISTMMDKIKVASPCKFMTLSRYCKT